MSLTLSNIQLQELLQRCKGSIRPWGEFVSTRKYNLPATAPTAGKRVLRNLDLYYGNYLVVFLLFLGFAIISSPILLLAIGLCLGVCYYIKLQNKDKNITLLGREFNPTQQYAGIMFMSVPLLWLFGAGPAFSWAVGLTIIIAMLHSILYNSDDIIKVAESSNIEHV